MGFYFVNVLRPLFVLSPSYSIPMVGLMTPVLLVLGATVVAAGLPAVNRSARKLTRRTAHRGREAQRGDDDRRQGVALHDPMQGRLRARLCTNRNML